MNAAPLDVIDHNLNLTGQNVLTYASWTMAVVLLACTVEMGRRERTPFYTLIVLASMVAAFAEPLYDTAFSLYFYSTRGMQTHFTAFGVPQPVWTHSGYAILYALPAVVFTYRIRHGRMTARGVYLLAGVELLMSCTFEIAGINMSTYTYWGPHALRIFHYPLVIGVLEAAQVVCFAVAAAHLRDRSAGPAGELGLFALFPATFFGANFGAGAAVIIAIHLEPLHPALVYAGTIVSIASAAMLVRFAAGSLPTPAMRRSVLTSAGPLPFAHERQPAWPA